MPVSMAIVCLIIGLTRPVRWKALECIARSARMPSVSRNEQSKLISLSLSLSLSLTGAALERKSSPRSALGTGSMQSLDDWRDKSVADNAARGGRAVVAR